MTDTTPNPTAEWIMRHDPIPLSFWPDPKATDNWHDVRSPYFETFYLPTLGPGATVLIRKLRLLALTDAEIPTFELARACGLSPAVSKWSPIVKSLCRLVQFNLARATEGRYEVRQTVPSLPERHAHRLPPHLQALLQSERTVRA